MPFPMRIQPIEAIQEDVVKPPVLKSRLKRLFDRPLNSVLRISTTTEKHVSREEKDGGALADFEPNSFCLDKMVQNFFEDNSEKQSSSSAAAAVKCCRHRCNCFHGNSNGGSDDDEFNFFLDSSTPNSSPIDSSFTLKSLTPCASAIERNLLADISFIIETNKTSCRRKDELREIVANELTALGYDASLCKSKWEKSSSIPAGEYEYVDAITDTGDRLIVDVDFRSEFEIARSTTSYRSILQNLPSIFVGKADRLRQILSIMAEAARLSLKKEGMHIAPWRKADYMKSKWLGPYTRIPPLIQNDAVNDPEAEVCLDCGDLDLIFGSETTSLTVSEAGAGSNSSIKSEASKPGSPATVAGDMTWKLPAVRDGRKNKAVVTGLASLLKEKT